MSAAVTILQRREELPAKVACLCLTGEKLVQLIARWVRETVVTPYLSVTIDIIFLLAPALPRSSVKLSSSLLNRRNNVLWTFQTESDTIMQQIWFRLAKKAVQVVLVSFECYMYQHCILLLQHAALGELRLNLTDVPFELGRRRGLLCWQVLYWKCLFFGSIPIFCSEWHGEVFSKSHNANATIDSDFP